MLAKLKKDFSFGTDVFDPTHRFETSWILPPYALFACRAVICIYVFTTLFTTLGYQCTHPAADSAYACQDSAESFSYFTVLTYWGIAFYHLVAAAHTFSYARWNVAFLDRWPRPLQALHAFYYTTVTTYPFLVTIVYWGVLYSYGSAWFPTTYGAWSNISEHAFNSLFALFEIFMTRTSPAPLVHMFWMIFVLALYLGLAYITRATQGWYTYSFLDPSKATHGLVAAYVFGIAIVILIVFGVVWVVIWTRRWLTETKLGMGGKLSGAHRSTLNSAHGDDVEMGSKASPTFAKPQ